MACTENIYVERLIIWDKYVSSHFLHLILKVYLLIFLFCSNRYENIHPRANPHDMCTSKHFAEFIGQGVQGMINENATVATVRAYWRQFTSSWAQRTFDPILEHIKKSITTVSLLLLLILSLFIQSFALSIEHSRINIVHKWGPTEKDWPLNN